MIERELPQTTRMISQADLVLALSREHRSAVVELDPASLKKVFTLRELERILQTVQISEDPRPEVRWREALKLAVRARHSLGSRAHQDDIIDPYRKTDSVYDQMLNDLVPAIDSLIAWDQSHRPNSKR
jgi:protein-tyrosine phosphatase